MRFDYLYQPHHSNRYPTVAKNGMVATSQPIAADAGLEILKQGGNAVDAAVATAACLTVVEPTSNGIGGDAFAICWINNELIGMNSSGKSPELLTADKLQGKDKMPKFGWTPVTVPGAPKAWSELIKKYGKLSLKEVLAPAIRAASEGYAITPVLGHNWERSFKVFGNLEGNEFKEWKKTFSQNGHSPVTGSVMKLSSHAETLQDIANTDAESFYKGSLADKIEASSIKWGGFIRKSDLSKHTVEWVKPQSINYKGYDVWELPPNGQGIIALEALNIFKSFNLNEMSTQEVLHAQIESLKLAFRDGLTHITDPNFTDFDYKSLLTNDYCNQLMKQVGKTATDFQTEAKGSGTVYLATADKYGNMVSFIQSNYMGFGSGIVVEDTGIALQNRGADFSLDPNKSNYLEPGKRTYHTIIPGFITKDNSAVGPFGVMGGYMQPQGHMQVISNLIDKSMNPQMALDAPRWQWIKNKQVSFEPSFSYELIRNMERLGHVVTIASNSGSFGRGQIILRNSNGTLVGGTESRTDSHIAVY